MRRTRACAPESEFFKSHCQPVSLSESTISSCPLGVALAKHTCSWPLSKKRPPYLSCIKRLTARCSFFTSEDSQAVALELVLRELFSLLEQGKCLQVRGELLSPWVET